MADAAMLAELTAQVKPVTDNYPARISHRLVHDQGRVDLYGELMDEAERLQRFRASVLVDRLWPEELKEASEPFFRYEQLIKAYFTGGAYASQSDPYLWDAIDDTLTNTTLETLPLWLLGSDPDNYRIIASLLERDGYRVEYAPELARSFAAQRDFETALMYMEDYVNASGEVSLWASNFYLYLLAKNGLADRSRPVIAQLAALQQPEVKRFVEWYTGKFLDGANQRWAPSSSGLK